MDDLQSSEQSAFVVEGEVEPLIIKVIEAHLKDKAYDDKFVAGWVNFINEDVIQGLNDLGKPFKYIGGFIGTHLTRPHTVTPACLAFRCAVHSVIMQNTGAGIHVSAAEYCDGVNDGKGMPFAQVVISQI